MSGLQWEGTFSAPAPRLSGYACGPAGGPRAHKLVETEDEREVRQGAGLRRREEGSDAPGAIRPNVVVRDVDDLTRDLRSRVWGEGAGEG